MDTDQPVSGRDMPGTIRARLTSFDAAHETGAITVGLGVGGSAGAMSATSATVATVAFAGAHWDVQSEFAAVPDRADAIDASVRFRVTRGTAREVAVAVEWEVRPWSPDVYVLIPAAAYNGNRYPCRAYRYPPMVHAPGDVGADAPILVTDVPRLADRSGVPSAIELNTGDAATPCICFRDPSSGRASILMTEQGSALGNHGLSITETPARDSAVLRIEAPCVRRDTLYTSCTTATPSWDRAADWAAGSDVVIRYRLYRFDAPELQALFDRLLVVRRDLSGPADLAPELPFSAAWRIVEKKYHEDNWCEDGYFRVGTHGAAARSRYQDWQAGWVGGGMVPFPMLLAGGPLSRSRALQNLSWMFDTAQHANGLFDPIRRQGVSYADGFDVPGTEAWYMVRKQADVLYFLGKTLRLLDRLEPDETIEAARHSVPHWRAGTLRLAELLAGTFSRSGQLGQYLDRDTGDVVVGGSTAAAIAPAALALCGELFDEPRYREVAIAIARQLDERDVRAGITTGGPGEILKCADSESAFAMLESFVVLFEVTGDRYWVQRAEAMAAQCATWCHSYDYRFPGDSWFGRLGMRTSGSVWANVQNKHSAPGICTLSGDSLLKLFRATGNLLSLELIRETAHNLPQYLSREDRQVGDPESMKPGWMCERVNTSDWEGQRNVGGSLFGSCWPEVSLMLTTVELPGLYVQPDADVVCVLDHLDLVLRDRIGDELVVMLGNPTRFDADVRVFSERASETRRALGQAAAVSWPVVSIPAGSARRLIFNVESGLLVTPGEGAFRV